MATRLEVKCVDRDDLKAPCETITHVGGGSGDAWRISVAQAVRYIETGACEFCVTVDGRLARLLVATGPGGARYLKAEDEGERPDSLLRLPAC